MFDGKGGFAPVQKVDATVAPETTKTALSEKEICPKLSDEPSKTNETPAPILPKEEIEEEDDDMLMYDDGGGDQEYDYDDDYY